MLQSIVGSSGSVGSCPLRDSCKRLISLGRSSADLTAVMIIVQSETVSAPGHRGNPAAFQPLVRVCLRPGCLPGMTGKAVFIRSAPLYASAEGDFEARAG